MRKIPGLDCILLVDDDQICNLVHKRIIGSAGIDVQIETARNGQEALEYLISTHNSQIVKPGIIFLDINMPEMNGWQFLQKYHELPNECKARAVVVMLSTSDDSDDKIKADNNPDVQNFLSKTLTAEKLKQIIATHF